MRAASSVVTTFLRHRLTILNSFVVIGVALTVFTEIVSLFHLIAIIPIIVFWIVLIGALIFWRQHLLDPIVIEKTVPRTVLWMLGSMGVLIAVIGFVALLSPPNNWDSMTYHMARVAHWQQNQSIAHYPTAIPRQNYQLPFAEYAILHLQILVGNDWLANMVQFVALLGSLTAVSLIAQRLGAGMVEQVMAMLIALTFPMTVLQGSSTQNDLVLSLWVMCLVVGILAPTDQRFSPKNVLYIGGSAGLAMTTKGTAFVYIMPLLAWYGAMLLQNYRLQAWRQVLLIGMIGIMLAAPNYVRNYDSYDSFQGPEGSRYTNGVFSPAAFASNLIRNMALHINFATPGLDERFNLSEHGDSVISTVHNVIGISEDDRRTNLSGDDYSYRAAFAPTEDHVGSPLHLAIYLVVLGLVVVRRRWDTVAAYTLVWLTMIVLFSIVFRWQPWQTRLMLPGFILGAPLAAAMIAAYRWQKLGYLALMPLYLLAVLVMIVNANRPLYNFYEEPNVSILNQTRTEILFENRPEQREPFVDAVNTIHAAGCNQIGLITGEDEWEYPLWHLWRNEYGQYPEIRHITPETTLPDQFVPCVVVTLNRALENDTLNYEEGRYQYNRRFTFGELDLFYLDAEVE